MCKKIHRGGNAEQYNADKKYKEAVAEAVEACADDTINYAVSLTNLRRFEEAKALMRKVLPALRRVFGENHELTLKMRWYYAVALYKDDGATLDDLHEAIQTLEETKRTVRRVFGGAHPFTKYIEVALRYSRAALRARETSSPPGSA